MQYMLDAAFAEAKQEIGKGKLVSFIPALANVDPAGLGFSIVSVDGRVWNIGDATRQFSIQSISKLIACVVAEVNNAPGLHSRVGRESAGHAFNSLVRLEEESGIPRNPFVNGGALVLSDILCGVFERPREALLSFVREVSGNYSILSDKSVSDCERELGARNTSIAYLIKSFGNLYSAVDDVLDLYFHNCAISMTCNDLASFFGFLANGGVCPFTQKRIFNEEQVRRVVELMSVAGLYEESGDFHCRVGVPTKSGVGGGIVGVIPGRYSFCAWSPELNEHGNSVAGLKFIERIVQFLK